MTTAGVDRSSNVVDDLCLAAQTVATAESLTGGLVVASLIDVPGASAVVRGGMVVYHPDLKVSLAGVDDMLLAVGGSVQSEVAAQLARGARTRFRATWGVGTTGVAGPGVSDGNPAGTVFIAVDGPGGTTVRRLELTGGRHRVRLAAVDEVLDLLRECIRQANVR
ncbi:CinA family protein [Austwickia chelonae]|uniref:CinA family protein n=1 Tax=Austwickia chelonae TaxID=100225 RepID=UPI000E27F04D|nr:CinA family protein [Austwickia chelonae]